MVCVYERILFFGETPPLRWGRLQAEDEAQAFVVARTRRGEDEAIQVFYGD